MNMIPSHFTDSTALTVDIIDIYVGFGWVWSSLIIYYKLSFLVLKRKVKLSQLWNRIKENNDLWFGLNFGEFLKEIENDSIFICLLSVEMSNTS